MSNTQPTPAAAIDGVCYLYPPDTSADFKAGWALALQMAKVNMAAVNAPDAMVSNSVRQAYFTQSVALVDDVQALIRDTLKNWPSGESAKFRFDRAVFMLEDIRKSLGKAVASPADPA